MKSVSAGRKPRRARLNFKGFTVTDNPDNDDLKMAYLSYRLGTLEFDMEPGLSAEDFIPTFYEYIMERYDRMFIVRKDNKPMFITFGNHISGLLWVSQAIWNPKATDRDKYKSAAKFGLEVSKVQPFMLESEFKYKKFYERLHDRKILRKIGTLYDTIEKGSRTTLFQARSR